MGALPRIRADPGPAGFKEGVAARVPSLTSDDSGAERGFEPTAVTGPGLSLPHRTASLSASYSLAPAKFAGSRVSLEGTNFCCDLPEPKLHGCCLIAKSCLTLATPWTVAARLLCPWDFPGKDTGVGCHFLLQGIVPTQGLNPRLYH